MNKESIAVIIPAYNEATTIGTVVRVALSSSFVNEVIVVSDGSTDETVRTAQEAGARTIDLKKNIGKGGAMRKGFEQTQASVIVFLDADLIGFTGEHLAKLIRPVLDQTAMMQVGIRDRGVFWTALAHYLPIISGERALRREILEHIPAQFYQGFMIEVALNYHCRTHRLKRGLVDLHGLSIRRKYQKVGWPKAVVQYSLMIVQIIWAILKVRFAKFIGTF
jgi:glycosyltransferase involved in cell wall biosynthesis